MASHLPSPLRDLGVSPPFELDILSLAAVVEGGAGDNAGLLAGDHLIAINGETITDVNTFVATISDSAGTTVVLEIERELQRLTLETTPQLTDRDGEQVGQLGVRLSSTGKFPPQYIREVDYDVLSAIPRSIAETYNMSAFVLKSTVKLVVGDLSPKNLSGPITIAKVAGDSARSGIDNFIRFVAILSIMLGVMNLLPIPVLDGGHLLYYIVEIVKGSPVSNSFQKLGYQAGLIMLLGLVLFATYNDIMRLV